MALNELSTVPDLSTLFNQGDNPSSATPVASTTTSGGGYYVFDNLNPGQYFVHIPASEFGTGQTLEGYASSTGAGADETTDENGDENGIDDVNLVTNGISSRFYDLQPNTEVTGEDETTYPGILDDDNVNFTADFGFHNDLVAIGNIVWIDNGAGGGTPDNGIMDGTEAGVANVDVELYAQGDTPGTDTPVLTTTTNANGYYQFDNLVPGSYFVHIPVSEFGPGQPLENYFSTTGAGSDETTDQNGDENGVDVNPEINGISSQDYNLQPNTEATGEDQSSYTGTLDDDNVNFTADFGFVRPAIQVEKSVDIAWVAPNQIVTYTIDITNTGDVTLNPVVVTDTMDPGLTYQSGTANPAGVVSNGQELVWADVTSGAGLAPGASIQITFLASVPTITGTYQNFVLVEGIHPTGSVTDTDDVPLHVEDPSVAIDKGVVPPGVVDGLITFTIRITNTGPSTLDQVPMFDNFTGPVEYYSAYPEPDDVDPVNNTLAWNDLTGSAPNGFDQNLNPGEAFVITTVFRLTTTDQEFSMTNEATVTSDTGNPAVDVLNNNANQPSDRVELVNEPTAITLLYFAGDRVGDNVVLNWATAVEINNFGFKLMRSTTGNLTDAVEIAFVNGQGSGTASGASYSYTDTDVEAGQAYTYWLVDVDNGGTHTIHDPITVEPTTLDGGDDVMIFLPLIFK